MLKSVRCGGLTFPADHFAMTRKLMTIEPHSKTPPFAVLWDQDGVIVDSGELHYQSWLIALDEFNIAFERETFDHTFGMNNTGIIRLLLGDPPAERIAQISDRKEIVYRQKIRGNLHTLPGVRVWLERLNRQGTPMAIASSAPVENIDITLEELGLRSFFDAIVSVAGRPGKPDPLVFLESASRLGMPPERCIVLEDGIPGVEAAKRAGMKCIAVTTTNAAEALAAADVVVERLDLLPEDIFQRLISNP
jgi:beta-phosphoglucomutase